MRTGPTHYLQWHITHCCNLRCAHCYQEEYRSHTPIETLLRYLDAYEAFLNGTNLVPRINLTGGEPLLHPDFFTLAEEIRRRGIRFSVLTNGTLIDDDTAARLARLKPVFVQVSLDGTEKIHDGIRGEGAFRKALDGIDALKRQGIKVLVSFTAQKSNYRSFAALARVCKKHRVDKLWFDRVVTDNPEAAKQLALTTPQFRRLVRTANLLHRLTRRPDGTAMVSVERALEAMRPCDGCYRCSAGENLLILLADGSLMPCRRLPFVIGHIDDGPIRRTFESSPVVQELRRFQIPAGCMGCKRLPECRGGSRCVTYAQTGSLHQKDVNCFYKTD